MKTCRKYESETRKGHISLKSCVHIYISLMLADPTTWIAVAPADLPL